MLFFRQFGALTWKNWIVLSRHWILNILRCFIFPVGFGIFLSVAQLFLIKPDNLGVGQPSAISTFSNVFDSDYHFYWVDATNGSMVPSPNDIMSHLTKNLAPRQQAQFKQLQSPDEVPPACQQNFNGFSECWAAVIFDDIEGFTGVNYTIRADAGLFYVNVDGHKSDVDRRILPLQWALDETIISLQTGNQTTVPQEIPYSQETNDEQSKNTRLSYIRGIKNLLVVVFFIGFLGIVYHLPGSFMGERATEVTSHMQAMGVLESARIISWHLSILLPYLPAYIIMALIWKARVFTNTNTGVLIAINVLTSFSLASWSMLVAAPFGKSPQLASIAATFLAILFAIVALLLKGGSTLSLVFSLVFPPGFFVFAIMGICAYERRGISPVLSQPDPDNGTRVGVLLIIALIDIFLYPLLAAWVESIRYNAKNPDSGSFGRKKSTAPPHPDDAAISVRNLKKTFSNASIFNRKRMVAIEDLSFTIPTSGIWILLGANGAGKSTVLSILANLQGRDSGSVTFQGGATHPARGTLGVVPQKNVFIPELTCLQTVRLWSAIKRPSGTRESRQDLVQLLHDCDLGKKVNAQAGSLSGGQKRKLQLSIGLVGGSNILLVDEATSGVDPLSRRALWRALTAVKHERTIIFTTHFLDEADLLGDHVAVLAAPGKILADGSPVSLKASLGEGYTISINLPEHSLTDSGEKHYSTEFAQAILTDISQYASHARCTQLSDTTANFALKSKDPVVVHNVLEVLQQRKDGGFITGYDVHGTTLEDIFINLMGQDSQMAEGQISEGKSAEQESDHTEDALSKAIPEEPVPLSLSSGRQTWFFQQAMAIVWKRSLILRRSWLAPLLAILIACCGACIPLSYMKNRVKSCIPDFEPAFAQSLLLPWSFAVNESTVAGDATSYSIVVAPPDALSPLSGFFTSTHIQTVADRQALIDDINTNYANLGAGGLFVDPSGNNSLIAFEAKNSIVNGPTILNTVSNVLLAQQVGAHGGGAPVIAANYMPFPARSGDQLTPLKWIGFFAAALGVFPAFFTLYVTKERRSSVQAMQLSNGIANPASLWFGHLVFDGIFGIITSVIIVAVFATVSTQFAYIGLYWLVLVLYFYTAILFAYCVSLMSASSIAAFSIVAGYQVLMFMLYLSAYLLTITYAKTSQTDQTITTIHYTMSLLAPINSLVRATLVSVNLFFLDCDGLQFSNSPGTLAHLGSPILYLIMYGLILFLILVAVDGGIAWPSFFTWRRRVRQDEDRTIPPDVLKEIQSVEKSDDPLRVLHVSKRYGKNIAVDDVSFGVARGTICALLGPNGAGKTTTFNMIRGEASPNSGDVLLKGMSITRNSAAARVSLGVCPQFTAIDSQLTVREHLKIYGTLKGLRSNGELERNIDTLLDATTLTIYADRLASKLSGGNQRKLALAIALIGNPDVVLIDEFSTGIAPDTKRAMWISLRKVVPGKAVVITTHSMEEATALANKVGIIAQRMLAVGTTTELASRYPYYEIHLPCRTRDELNRAQQLMSTIPNARMADDVATRWEVPLQPIETRRESRTGSGSRSGSALALTATSDPDSGLAPTTTLAQLFSRLSEQRDFPEFSVDMVSLESVFLKLIREHQVEGEDSRSKPWWKCA